jgi:hypothetical protein
VQEQTRVAVPTSFPRERGEPVGAGGLTQLIVHSFGHFALYQQPKGEMTGRLTPQLRDSAGLHLLLFEAQVAPASPLSLPIRGQGTQTDLILLMILCHACHSVNCFNRPDH